MTGPVRPAVAPPGLPAGYVTADFAIDWDQRSATCPRGATSSRWIDTAIRGEPRIHIDFAGANCPKCPLKYRCTNAAYRVLTLPPRAEYEILHQRRAEQDTDAWKERYSTRAGVEGRAR